jgi:four helix bundle protein
MSVPANIAEGANREHKKEYLHFLYIARGSLAETEYYLHLSRRLNYGNDSEYDRLDKLRIEAASTLNGLIQAVKKETS